MMIYIFAGQTPIDIFQNFYGVLEYYQALNSGHDSTLITRPIAWIIRTEKEQIIAFILFISLNIINIYSPSFLKRRINLFSFFFTIPIYLTLFLIFKEKVFNTFFLSIPISGLVIYLKKHFIFKELIKDLNLKFCIFNLMLPFAYSFGTAHNYWVNSQNASIFYICSSFFILNSLKNEN